MKDDNNMIVLQKFELTKIGIGKSFNCSKLVFRMGRSESQLRFKNTYSAHHHIQPITGKYFR
jgi:hypothetical protein